MRKQQQVWLEEHTSKGTLPTMADTEPASGVVYFCNFLKSKGITSGKVIDIGSGKGRNSVYFAKQGYYPTGIEYISLAIEAAEKLAVSQGVAESVTFVEAEADKQWPFENNSFDIAIDSFSSIDIETRSGREICRNEMYRTLKSGGYALVTVCSAKDEWERELIAKHPGPEPNSCIWPQNQKFQKDYDDAELRGFYSDFEIIELKEVTKPAFKLGRKGTATNLWLIVRKP